MFTYCVAYTPVGTPKKYEHSNREYYDDITTKAAAFKIARKLKRQGNYGIMIDKYDMNGGGQDLVKYWSIDN